MNTAYLNSNQHDSKSTSTVLTFSQSSPVSSLSLNCIDINEIKSLLISVIINNSNFRVVEVSFCLLSLSLSVYVSQKTGHLHDPVNLLLCFARLFARLLKPSFQQKTETSEKLVNLLKSLSGKKKTNKKNNKSF